MPLHRLTVTFGCEESALADEFAQLVEKQANELGLSEVVVKQRKCLEELLGVQLVAADNDAGKYRSSFDRVMDVELDEYGHYPD